MPAPFEDLLVDRSTRGGTLLMRTLKDGPVTIDRHRTDVVIVAGESEQLQTNEQRNDKGSTINASLESEPRQQRHPAAEE